MFYSPKSNSKFRKILTIQFKYLGDAVFITPALQALHHEYPTAEIHILTAEEVAPIFEHLSFIKKTWAFPRTRGKAKLSKSLPFVFKLRREKFDLTIDFVGNDRGGILSFLIAAKARLAALDSKASFIKKVAYTKTIATSQLPTSWVKRHLKMLALLLGVSEKKPLNMKIVSDPSLASKATKALDGHQVICHLGTSQPKKEWPISEWIAFYDLATKAGYKLAFSTGTNAREQNLMAELRNFRPNAFTLNSSNNLAIYLAILGKAKLVISGDTGPLHFAAGLGVKVIGLFGTADSVLHAAPIYQTDELVMSTPCKCINELSGFPTCQSASPCMHSISADQVFRLLKERFPLKAT